MVKHMRRLIPILALLLAGCGGGGQSSNPIATAPDNPASSVSTDRPASPLPQTIESILGLPEDFESSYKIVEIRDASLGSVKRLAVSIALPAGLKKEEAERNFKHAILQIYKERKPDAITIWGYREGDDIKQPFTVGDAVFAPEGKWENAGGGGGANLQNFQAVINVKDSYLNDEKTIAAGDLVTLTAFKSDVLKNQDAGSVRVWNDSGNRYDSNILTRVPNGTKARILETRQSAGGDYASIVYKVEVQGKTGWVDFFDVKEYQDNESKK